MININREEGMGQAKEVYIIMIDNGFDSAYPELVLGGKKEAKDYIEEKDNSKQSKRHYPIRYLIEAPFKPKEIW